MMKTETNLWTETKPGIQSKYLVAFDGANVTPEDELYNMVIKSSKGKTHLSLALQAGDDTFTPGDRFPFWLVTTTFEHQHEPKRRTYRSKSSVLAGQVYRITCTQTIPDNAIDCPHEDHVDCHVLDDDDFEPIRETTLMQGFLNVLYCRSEYQNGQERRTVRFEVESVNPRVVVKSLKGSGVVQGTDKALEAHKLKLENALEALKEQHNKLGALVTTQSALLTLNQ